jgi:hypothetical protein
LFHHGIERIATGALDTQKVPIASVRFAFAIIAHDIDHSLQIPRHGMFGNISRPGFPRGRHALLRDDRLFANGTTIIKASEFAKTVGMNRMSTWQILWRLAGRKHVFAADGAIVLVLVLEALMRIKDTYRNAHAAFLAMPKGVDATDAAKATLRAMKGFFGLK